MPIALLAFYAATGDPAELLRRTAAVYEEARSFELAASLSVKVPGEDLVITTGQTAVYAGAAMLPADAPVPILQIGTVGGKLIFRNSAGEAVKAKISGFGVESVSVLFA